MIDWNWKAVTPRAVPAAVVLVPIAMLAQGRGEVRGRIVNESGEPVAGAAVTIVGIGYTLRADSAGRFALTGTPGSAFSLTFRASGFRIDSASVVLTRGATIDRTFTLARDDGVPPRANPSASALRGYVIEPSGQPLSYANIQLNGGRRILSDDSGRFVLPFAVSGPATLIVRRIGFEPAEVKLDGLPDTALRIELAPIPVALKGVLVTGASAFRSLDIHGFYGRMKDAERGINHGYFITPEDIERRKPNWITQMADGFPTVRVVHGHPPMKDVIRGSLNCKMTVYLDNVRIVGRMNGRDDYVNELAPPNHVAAMEIYPRAVSAPPQYQPLNGTCGVVLIWTR
ncbi:MAG TPA: carboxypeptidase regulatory-like domain-containing protein [Gemmatimonadaceae bacterium]